LSHSSTLDHIKLVQTSLKQQLSDLEVSSGEVEIQGGIYDLETGQVEFLGRSPAQATWMADQTAAGIFGKHADSFSQILCRG
jgi:DNA helicase TIP49 (TBP-interacting protein)